MIGRANIVHAKVIAKLWHHSNIIMGGELIFLSFSTGIYKYINKKQILSHLYVILGQK